MLSALLSGSARSRSAILLSYFTLQTTNSSYHSGVHHLHFLQSSDMGSEELPGDWHQVRFSLICEGCKATDNDSTSIEAKGR